MPRKGAAAATPAVAKPGALRAFRHGGEDKFWEISVDGKTIRTRHGKTGANGQIKLKELGTPAAALAEVDVMIAKKVKEGYAEAGGGSAAPGGGGPGGSDPRNPELEAAVVDHPYDADAYSVLADWLQDQGDPRGELIALQLANKNAQAAKLLAKHEAHFLGPLAAHKKTYDGSRRDVFTWKNGYLHGVRLSHNHYASEGFTGSLAQILEQVLAHPSGRFLRELTLVFNNDPNEDTLQDLIDLLAKKPRPTLLKLHLGDFRYNGVDSELSWYHVGKLGKLWKQLPNLETLIVQGGEFTLGAIDLPNVRDARFITGGLAKADGRALATAKWPKIEHLEIWYGDDNYGCDCTVKEVTPLLGRTDLPNLTWLGLKNAMFADDIARVLPPSPLARQLMMVDLSLGCMTDAGAALLGAAGHQFVRLAQLDVGENYLTPAGVRSLKGVAPKVLAKEQREDEDPEYRHPAVGE